MLHTLLGEQGFQKGMRTFILLKTMVKRQPVKIFVSAMERANDVDLAQFRRWYSQSGTPELLISDAYDDKLILIV